MPNIKINFLERLYLFKITLAVCLVGIRNVLLSNKRQRDGK